MTPAVPMHWTQYLRWLFNHPDKIATNARVIGDSTRVAEISRLHRPVNRITHHLEGS